MASSGKLITSAGIVDGTIATANLVADAVTTTTIGTGFGNTTTSTTLVLVSTLNFSAGAGRCFLVFNVAIVQTVAVGLQQLVARLDGGTNMYLHYETAVSLGANASRAGEFVLNGGATLSGGHAITIYQATSAGSFGVSPFNYWVREYKR